MKKACREPRLNELFEDSAMRLLMASDKVDEAALRALLVRVVASRPASASHRCACEA
jgi:Spy/CpxP family protein refolding chaperone